ncbi:PREDICTED: uncharacterized protein LOC106783818 [Polistes canadensis]|uniref:uncharacterized protein LOC106783818 n=1 Tax=Polistes canadensis TaxID=91411 RepID=UPI000718F7C7|nr:PREDICTED: uncharacterized protein LOC106783818 [Polistes canadensis]
MALSLALPLSGVETEHFYALGAQAMYNNGLRAINGIGPYSPSTDSESSSGFSSLTPSIESSENVESDQTTPSSSRSSSPINSEDESNIIKVEKKVQQNLNQPIKIIYDNRDILNLGANIRDPVWMLMRYNGQTKELDKNVYEGLPNALIVRVFECWLRTPEIFLKLIAHSHLGLKN